MQTTAPRRPPRLGGIALRAMLGPAARSPVTSGMMGAGGHDRKWHQVQTVSALVLSDGI
jgi:hypothetical protein